MESARIRRNINKAKLLRIQNYLDNNPLGTENVSVYHYKARLDMLAEAYSSFKQCHHDLTTYIPINDAEEWQTNEIYYLQVQEMFIQLEQELLRRISVLSSPVNTIETHLVLENTTGSVRQFTIRKSPEETTIPSFSDNLCDWPSFFNIFSSSVHLNSDLPDVLKFMYLRSFLKGEALSYIQHFHITNYNYSAAWNKLITGYGRQTQIIQSTVLQTPKCDVSKLTYPISTCYAPAIVKNHPTSSIKPPTTSKGLSNNNNNSSNHTNTVHKQLSTSINCTVCAGGHAVHQCLSFKKFNISFRCEFARNNNLCANCLYDSHSVAECKITSSCKVCKNRHHTLLHTDSTPSCPIITSSNSTSHGSSSDSNSIIQRSSSPTNCSTVSKSLLVETFNDLESSSSTTVHTIHMKESSNQQEFQPSQPNTFNLYLEALQIHLQSIIHHRPKSFQQFQCSQSAPRTHLLVIYENQDTEVVSTCLANWKDGGIKLIVSDISSWNFFLFIYTFHHSLWISQQFYTLNWYTNYDDNKTRTTFHQNHYKQQ